MGGSVVVGLDGSRHSLPAVRWGAEEAAARGLTLHLLHAWNPRPSTVRVAHDAAARKHHGAEVLASAEAAAHGWHPGIIVTTEQVPEEAVEALVDRSGQAAMVVLGSRGHEAVDGFLLGSVSLHVLGRAECPVVTVREGQSDPCPRPVVVVGVQDVGPPGEAVLDLAFTVAEAHRGSLRAVRAWEPGVAVGAVPPPEPAPDAAEREVGEQKALADALGPWRARFPDVEVTEEVARGKAVPALLGACSRAGLLVIGRRVGRSPTRLGPVVLAVLHHGRCPVAVVPRT
ncbi:universal stress protein [Streptomyces natalensis]|uniref:UspA domain-containing protein n=1 Tax=Streptomyces natalensis ATCC 27448 TaxID=1240678 RepID=A0A0D7CJV6_9ACTN|nr:universal stress protein [Streptomyces natalensis]KIZ16150.1 hypothetical protein SNA_23375 [Streptomyces natalensis ATCC 27448]